MKQLHSDFMLSVGLAIGRFGHSGQCFIHITREAEPEIKVATTRLDKYPLYADVDLSSYNSIRAAASRLWEYYRR